MLQSPPLLSCATFSRETPTLQPLRRLPQMLRSLPFLSFAISSLAKLTLPLLAIRSRLEMLPLPLSSVNVSPATLTRWALVIDRRPGTH
jgi:hypothetical protein